MLKAVNAIAPSSNFQMKNQVVELAPANRSTATMTVRELEAIRTGRAAIPASKHGLEAICGASCETGAQ